MRLTRRVANRSLDWLLFNRSFENYWLERMRGRVLCLLYHRIDEPGRQQFLDEGGVPVTSPREFDADLRFLVQHGVRFLRFADLLAGDFPAQDEIGLIICFDDGFVDNYTTALELLGQYDIPTTIFQCSAMIDGDALLWEHRLYWYAKYRPEALLDLRGNQPGSATDLKGIVLELRETYPAIQLEARLDELDDHEIIDAQQAIARKLYPTGSQLQAAKAQGHEIASHGHHHYKRSNIDAVLFEQELKSSREVIGRVTGEPPECFSYPFNSYHPGDKQICSRYFSQVATVDGGFIENGFDPLAMPRATWPGPAVNEFRRRRWLLTGHI